MAALVRSRAHAIVLRGSALHPLGVIMSVGQRRGEGN
jgi:hypothetical protein